MTGDVCIKCGRCCEIKARTGRFFRCTGEYCEHLGSDGLCDVYDERVNKSIGFGGGNVCLSSEDAFKHGFLPIDCPYIKYYVDKLNKRYKCMVLNYKDG